MGEVEKKDLGEVGRTYVREYLRDMNVFCTALLETIESSAGEVFTFAPADTSQDRLSKFEWGGLLPENLAGADAIALPDGNTLVPVISLVEKQISLLRETMESAGVAVCIADDFNPRWSERPAWLEPSAFGVGEEVYHLLTLAQTGDEFLPAVSNKTLWHDVSAVCRVAPKLDDTRTTTPSELSRSAASALLITCAAYDGEGFVAWRRGSASGHNSKSSSFRGSRSENPEARGNQLIVGPWVPDRACGASGMTEKSVACVPSPLEGRRWPEGPDEGFPNKQDVAL